MNRRPRARAHTAMLALVGLLIAIVTACSGPAPAAEPLRLPPRPSATPAPAPLSAFASRVSTRGFRTRARIDGVMHVAIAFYEFRATARFRGTRVTAAYDRGSSRSIVLFGASGNARIRSSRGGPSVLLPSGVRSGNPFGTPEAIEVQYKGKTTFAGKKVHRLTISNPRSLAAALGGARINQLQPESSAYDVYVTDKGKPVGARVRFRGTAAVTSFTVQFDIDFRYTFTSVR